jgi:hypothetical protein
MCLISGGVALTLNLTNYLINNLCTNKLFKYLLIGSFLVLFRSILPDVLSFTSIFFISIWLVLFYLLLDYVNIKITTDVSELSTIFWLLYVCISFTVLLLYFTNQREQQNKIRFVKEFSILQLDKLTEVHIDTAPNKIDTGFEVGRKNSRVEFNNDNSLQINLDSQFPELLTTPSLDIFNRYPNYATAIYVNGKLKFQKGDIQFPIF